MKKGKQNKISLLWHFLEGSKGLFAVSILLYNVYFIDAALSLIPAGFVIYQVFGKFLTLAPAAFASLAIICAVSHLLLMVFENNLSRKEQDKPKV